MIIISNVLFTYRCLAEEEPLLEGLQRRGRGRKSRFWVHPLN
jgi:hypothetical protein